MALASGTWKTNLVFDPNPQRALDLAQSSVAGGRVSFRLVSLNLLLLDLKTLRERTLAQARRSPGLDQAVRKFVERGYRSD